MAKKKGGTIDLLVENYKAAKHLHVVLVPGCNEIGGPNGAGKSSGLDAAANIFGGTKLTPPEPIHEGAEGYYLDVKLSELGLHITRTGTLDEEGKLREELIVAPLEGEGAGRGLGRPMELLKTLLGAHSIVLKPLLELSNADRIALLQRCAGLDFADADAKADEIYKERTGVNSKTEALKNRVEAMPSYPDAPKDLVSITDLISKRDALQEANAANYRAQRDLEDKENVVAQIKQEAERLQIQADEAAASAEEGSRALKEAVTILDEARAEVAKLKDVDIDPLNQQIAGAETVNEQVRANTERVEVAAHYTASKDRGTELTGKLREISDWKKQQLADAKIPGGLSLEEGAVRLKNKPLEQASQVERMDVDIAIAIAQNPKVPIILINEGSRYDKIHRGKLDKVAKKHGVYVFFERVIDTEEDAEREGVAVFMKDGVGINIKEAADADSK